MAPVRYDLNADGIINGADHKQVSLVLPRAGLAGDPGWMNFRVCGHRKSQDVFFDAR